MSKHYRPRCGTCSTGRTGGVCTCNRRVNRRPLDPTTKR